jgi:hypothetical protein
LRVGEKGVQKSYPQSMRDDFEKWGKRARDQL